MSVQVSFWRQDESQSHALRKASKASISQVSCGKNKADGFGPDINIILQ